MSNDKKIREQRLKGITVASLKTPQKQGILTKRGGAKANWRKRHFVLHEGKLYYFGNGKPKSAPKGSIDLEASSTVGETSIKKKFAFEIKTTKRTFYIFAKDDAEKKAWMEAIQKAIADLGSKNPGDNKTPDTTNNTNNGTAGGSNPDGEKPGVDSDSTDTDDSPDDDMKNSQKPKDVVNGGSHAGDRPRDRLARAKDTIPFLRKEDSKVVEFWQIWSESFPPADGLSPSMAIEFEVSCSLSMEKLKWRTCGPQNMFIQRMVDFFFDVGASENEIDRLNNIGALIEPAKIGSWIEMSDKQGMDGGWYFPVDMPIDKAIQASDSGEAVEKVKEWIGKHKIESCFAVGRDMGAMPPRQTSMKINLPGPFAQQMESAIDAFQMFGFPMIPDDALNVLKSSNPSSISLSIITCSEGFVQIGILAPSPSKETIKKLAEITKVDRKQELDTFEEALGGNGPAFCEYQHLMHSFGYGVYKEGFDVILHYKAGEERGD